MSSVTYREFTGTAAENYRDHFVPAIGTPVSAGLMEAADLRPGERVLDVACGTGLVARLAAERVGPTGSVTGLDVAPDMIAVAQGSSGATGPEIDWRVGDAAALPMGTGEYDVALCQMGLMFMEDRGAAVAEMRRVLAPGGRLVVNTPGAIQPPFELMEQAIADNISPELGGFVRGVFSMPDPGGVAELLADGGLVDVAADASSATLRLPAPAVFLWQYINLTPMGPLVAEAPEEAKISLERQVVDAWAPYVVDGATPVEQPMVIGSGRR